jgi:hypothetical protein
MTSVRESLRSGREALGIYADIGGALAFSILIVALAIWLRDRHSLLAVTILGVGALSVGGVAGFMLGRGRRVGEDEGFDGLVFWLGATQDDVRG